MFVCCYVCLLLCLSVAMFVCCYVCMLLCLSVAMPHCGCNVADLDESLQGDRGGGLLTDTGGRMWNYPHGPQGVW